MTALRALLDFGNAAAFGFMLACGITDVAIGQGHFVAADAVLGITNAALFWARWKRDTA